MSDEIVIERPTSELQNVRRIVAKARKLRRNSTDVERRLWHRIRDKQIDEFRFRRQRPIGRYIVDFICLEAKLIVELDGGQHATSDEYDKSRTAFLESLGYRVVRFWNNEVTENMDGVLQRLHENLLRSRTNPTLTPLQGALAAASASRSARATHASRNPRSTPLAGEGTDRASGEVAAGTPSLARRGKAGMGVQQQNAGIKKAPKEKK